MTDWKAIKVEYVSGTMSLRELANSHKLNYSTLAARSSKEGWASAREKSKTKVADKMIEKAVTTQVNRYERLIQVSDRVLEGIFKQLEENGIPQDTKQLKAITGALKDLKEIQDCKGSLDLEEQKARIERLRVEVNNASIDKDVKVIMDSSLEEYAR